MKTSLKIISILILLIIIIVGVIIIVNKLKSRVCISEPGNYCSFVDDNMVKKCPLGSYCPDNNMTYPKDCPSGYYCPDSALSPIICPIGYYCPDICVSEEGYSEEYCQYNNISLICSKGYYCPRIGLTGPNICPSGYYCPTGSAIQSIKVASWFIFGYGTNNIVKSDDGSNWTNINNNIFSISRGIVYNGSNLFSFKVIFILYNIVDKILYKNVY